MVVVEAVDLEQIFLVFVEKTLEMMVHLPVFQRLLLLVEVVDIKVA